MSMQPEFVEPVAPDVDPDEFARLEYDDDETPDDGTPVATCVPDTVNPGDETR